MNPVRRYAFVPFIALSVIHVLLIAFGNDGMVAATKPLLMPMLLLGFLSAAPMTHRLVVGLVVGGIVFSWAGDVLLQSPGDIGFLVGLGAFLVAHLFYITAFLKLGTGKVKLWVWAYLIWYGALLALLIPGLGSLVVPVILYGAVLGTMAILATRVNAVVGWGGLLFLVSDSILAMDRFMPGYALPASDVVIMTTYLIGEGLIAYGVVRALRALNAQQS